MDVKMRRVVISLVSLWAVLWHAHVGCCAHHDHALVGGESTPAVCTAGHQHADRPQHHHDASPTEPSPPASHEDCHESHCHAVLASALAVPDLGGFASWLLPVGSAGETVFGLGYADCSGLAPDVLRPLSLRAHLRFAVLLI
jgi:hypothetical protein